MSALRVVVAPDSYKGSATAADAAAAIARGWASVRPVDELRLRPMADGGEGTLDAFASAVPGARRVPVRVEGPDGREVAAHWVLLPDGTGVVELAATSGLALLREPAPLTAHTRGFGQAIAAALDHGVDRLLLALGGSCSTDGGAAALQALGACVLDAQDRPVPPGNAGLASAVRVDVSDLRPLPAGGALVLCDVSSPLLGDAGAAAVFGPQKGATPGDVRILERNLESWVTALTAGASARAGDPATPGAGAAGGTGFGLLAWGARMTPGAPAVAAAIGLSDALAEADAVITGEGRFDSQSAAGKVPSFVMAAARRAGVPSALVAGRIDAPTDGFAAAVALCDLAGGAGPATAQALRWLEAAGVDLARRVGAWAVTAAR